MVAARAAFLDAGHYAPLADAAAEAAREAAPPREGGEGCVADLGAGTGHHLARVLGRLPRWVGLALDSAPAALRRAVRAHPRIGAVVCDAWRPLPVRDGAADLVLNVFAPRNGDEIARMLAPDGAVIVVTPAARHLAELAGRLGLLRVQAGKAERLEAKLAPLRRTRRHDLAFPLTLSRADARALATMGPSAHHLRPDDLDRDLAALPEPFEVTAEVTVETFQRR
jgi:23S rRNA (guanine745-N1)-methyltransferase